MVASWRAVPPGARELMLAEVSRFAGGDFLQNLARPILGADWERRSAVSRGQMRSGRACSCLRPAGTRPSSRVDRWRAQFGTKRPPVQIRPPRPAHRPSPPRGGGLWHLYTAAKYSSSHELSCLPSRFSACNVLASETSVQTFMVTSI